MKATVLESKDGRSVILAEDGTFHNVNEIYEVGQVIDFSETARKIVWSRAAVRRVAAAAAALVLALTAGLYSYQNLAVYATVSLDGDAPMVIELNRKGKVINVEAVNEEDSEAAEELEKRIKGRKIEEAVNEAADVVEGDAGAVSVTVECRNEDKKNEISRAVEKTVEKKKEKASSDKGNGGENTGRGEGGGSVQNGKDGAPADDGKGNSGTGGELNRGGDTENNGSGGAAGEPAPQPSADGPAAAGGESRQAPPPEN